MEPTVFIIRHGITEMNDPENERVRGYADVPLSYEGKLGVEATAKFLQEGGYPINRILSSPLQRAIMTAAILSNEHAVVRPDNGLLPWNLGDLMGQPVKVVASKMSLLQANPDIQAPHGESYRTFFNRWDGALRRMFAWAEANPEEILVGVVHSRNILALPSLLDDKDIGNVPVKGGASPASVTEITKGDDGWTHKVIWEQKI